MKYISFVYITLIVIPIFVGILFSTKSFQIQNSSEFTALKTFWKTMSNRPVSQAAFEGALLKTAAASNKGTSKVGDYRHPEDKSNNPTPVPTGIPKPSTQVDLPVQGSSILKADVERIIYPLVSSLKGAFKYELEDKIWFSYSELTAVITSINLKIHEQKEHEHAETQENTTSKILAHLESIKDEVKNTLIICSKTSDAVTGKMVKEVSVPMTEHIIQASELPQISSLIHLLGSMEYYNENLKKNKKISSKAIRFWAADPSGFLKKLPEIEGALEPDILAKFLKKLYESSLVNGVIPAVP